MTPAPPAPATSPPPIHLPLDTRLRRFLTWAVVILSAGYTFLDYWNYSRMWHADPREWADLLAGRGLAPAQYRIGVMRLAAFLAQHLHTHLRHMFALIDCVSLLIGLACILALLSRTALFRAHGASSSAHPVGNEDHLRQWTLSLLCLGLFTVYLSWTFWFQKPETLPTLAYFALSALLAASHARGATRWLFAALLLLLAVLQATVRADAAVAFHLGMLMAAVLPSGSRSGASMPLGRMTQAVTSGLAIVAAGAVQYGIAHWLYPGAQRNTDTFQLLSNLRSSMGYLAITLSLAAWWVTLWLAARRWRTLHGLAGAGNWALGLLLGSLAHFAMFYAFGMAEEVRIFLPFAMAVLPVTTVLFYRAFIADQGLGIRGRD
ncbi:MAG: hypothetical protein ACR2JE_09425 [Acidobacteriaceae bacterium]